MLDVVHRDPVLQQAAQQDPQLASLLDPDTLSQVLSLIQSEGGPLPPSGDQQQALAALSRNRKALARLQTYAQQLLLQKQSNQHTQAEGLAEAKAASAAGFPNGGVAWSSSMGQGRVVCSPPQPFNDHKGQADQGPKRLVQCNSAAFPAHILAQHAAAGHGGGVTDRWEMLKQRMSKYHGRAMALATGTLPSVKGPSQDDGPVKVPAVAAGEPLGLGGAEGVAAVSAAAPCDGGLLQQLQGAEVRSSLPASKRQHVWGPTGSAAATAASEVLDSRSNGGDALPFGCAKQNSKGMLHTTGRWGQAQQGQQQQQQAFSTRASVGSVVVPTPSNYLSVFAPLQSPLMPAGQIGSGPYASGCHSSSADGGMGFSHDLLQLLSAVPEAVGPAAAAGRGCVQASQPLSPGLQQTSPAEAAAAAVRGGAPIPAAGAAASAPQGGIASPIASPAAAVDGGQGRWAWGSWLDSALGMAAPTSPAAAAGCGQGDLRQWQLSSSCSDTEAARSAAGSRISVRGAASSTHKVLRPHSSSPLPGEHPLSPAAHPLSPVAATCSSRNGSISVSMRGGNSMVGSPLAGAVTGRGLELRELTAEAVRERLASGDVVVEIDPPTKLATNLSWSTSPTAEFVLDAGSSGALPVAYGGSRGSLCSSSNGMPDGRTLGSGPSLRLSIPEEEGANPWGPQLQPFELGANSLGLELVGALSQGSYDEGRVYDSMRLGSSTFSQSTGGPSAPTSPDRVSQGGRRGCRSSSSGEQQWARTAAAAAPGASSGVGSSTSSMRERKSTAGAGASLPAAADTKATHLATSYNAASSSASGYVLPGRRSEVQGQGVVATGAPQAGNAMAAAAASAGGVAVGALGGAAAAATGPGAGDMEYYRLMYRQRGIMPGRGAAAWDEGGQEGAGVGDQTRLDPRTYYEDVAPSNWRPDGEENCSALYR